jgi:hypothetical protein
MKTSTIFATAAFVLHGQHVQATPISSLIARGKSSALLSILELIKGFIPVDEPVEAWLMSPSQQNIQYILIQ